ncbi:3-oxoacyl-ACP reductase FabG [Bradyrhizobium sp. 83012]|uniref:3-oxoacyl-ACP reductase FabG n=1 Tax=Bradyrhizobium aeschynomenes TaxID=2734909 RepID=A0ABX2CDQ0_9BRAD|nr:3-oxoacyl-ACP reductase FabG [Bradyrhizobium aeschynomenes]NPU66346.1 3-oxoacyl-ACP reductase FabG [Bradyrhizobium aeschynomenes]NPV20058.1 3-oxoacyl-ACP reductase FabG [Bradyrhizobium aeschynomenes]
MSDARGTSSAADNGRVALVTGGAGGIGLAIVRRLLEEGFRVAFVARQEDHVARALDHLGCDQARLMAEAIDVTCLEKMTAFIDRLRRRWDDVTVLVNNAGISPKRRDPGAPWIMQTSPEEWQNVLAVNLNAPFVLTRLVAPAMIRRRAGRIVNIGSLAGRAIPQIAGPHYAASKAGLVGLTRATARDLAPFGITVNCIAPGRILSDMTGPADSEVNRAALSRIPLGRFGTADEVAGLVGFLVSSPAAAFLTGATLDVTGGEFAA